MKIQTILPLFIILGITTTAFTTNLSIENVRVVYRPDVIPDRPSVLFDIRWENAWHNSKNHDAV